MLKAAESGVTTQTVSANPFVEFRDRYSSDPVLFVQEVLAAEPDANQIKVLNAVGRGERRVTIRSGHGVGKTATLAWLIIWHLLTRFPQKVLATAPTSSQLFDALASEVKFWIKKLPAPLQEVLDVKSESIVHKGSPAGSFVSFATSRAETPEALAGKHSENMLIIADEASGVPEAVYEAAIGSMSGENATTVLAGNPIRSQGFFFDTHNKPEVMKDWFPVHISCENHPRVSQDFVRQVAAQYGEKSNAYRVRVLGEFPLADDDTVIPLELAEAALHRDVQPTNTIPIWGLDCARFGPDESALAKRKGNVLMEKVRRWNGLDTMELVGRVKDEWDRTLPSERPDAICVDAIGLGAGVADRLRELGLPVYAINVGESPSMKDKYRNLRAELWYDKMRTWFAAKDSYIAGDVELRDQVTKPRYTYTANNKIQIESKDQMKKRGVASPDVADAFMLTFAVEAAWASGKASGTSTWTKPLKRIIKGIV